MNEEYQQKINNRKFRFYDILIIGYKVVKNGKRHMKKKNSGIHRIRTNSPDVITDVRMRRT